MRKKINKNSLKVAKFNKANTTTCNVRLNKRTDFDIIQKLSEVPSKMGYIKSLIRADIIANSKK